jgi:cyclic pyranopterin phosphate synthase
MPSQDPHERYRWLIPEGGEPPQAPRLTHTGAEGARMVDVTEKPDTVRQAVASGRIRMRAETLALIRENRVAKGSVIETARLAGIMAAKRTAELIPLCHSLPLTEVAVDCELSDDPPSVSIRARATCVGKTGAEMEALTAVAVACLTVYDMCKAADRGMVIEDVKLLEKSGGKSGHFVRPEEERL